MPTIGLCLIVRDEAHVIERCLQSCLPLVDHVTIQDTGSTDGTQGVARAFLDARGMPHHVHDCPWQDFATNRTLAMDAVPCDYSLTIDADDRLEILCDPAEFKAGLAGDAHAVQVVHGGTHFSRPQLLRTGAGFRYRGVLHEFVELGGAVQHPAPGIRILASNEGARSRNPNKYRDDADLLKRALLDEADPFMRSRYIYYLAQSLRDAGDHAAALPYFMARAELGYWHQERFIAMLNAARCMRLLDWPVDDIVAVCTRATALCPDRSEAAHQAAVALRLAGRMPEAWPVIREAVRPQPDGLFVEAWVYDYAALDEFAVAAYWAGAYRDSLDACLTLLAGKLPEADRARVCANARHAFGKLVGGQQGACAAITQSAARGIL